MYVKIIDRGECFSTTMEYIDGVYANRTEWAKHNFYPQNGMVGEVVKRTPTAFIIKIADGIYIPMTKKGIKEISASEYNALKGKVKFTGMDERQKRINEGLDNLNALTGYSWQHLPDMRENFKTDIIENIKKLTCEFKRNIFLPDLEEACVMYAADMCLEYKAKSGANLAPHVVEEISLQVTDVFVMLFPSDFRSASIFKCKKQIKDLVASGDARERINKYYQAINMRWSLS